MLTKRRVWLERAANWGTALAVPLVAIVGFRLLTHARDAARPVPGQTAPPSTAAGRVLAPPIDASAPPVVSLRPAPTPGAGSADPRCAALERAIAAADLEAAHASAPDAARLHDRGQASRAQARALGCAPR